MGRAQEGGNIAAPSEQKTLCAVQVALAAAALHAGCAVAAGAALSRRGEPPLSLPAAKALAVGPLALLEVLAAEPPPPAG